MRLVLGILCVCLALGLAWPVAAVPFQGVTLELGQLDLLPVAKYLGFNCVHWWPNRPEEVARCVLAARRYGLEVAVFVPAIDIPARFYDGSASSDHYDWPGPGPARVPDFYNPEWQQAFLASLLDLKQRLGGDFSNVAILWLNNEPEVYHSYAAWTGPDFCLNTPSTLAEGRRFAEEQYQTLAALNTAWSEGGSYNYSFSTWDAFERDMLTELFADFEDDNLNAGAKAGLDAFVRKWLQDWGRIASGIIRDQAGITQPLLGMRLFPGLLADWSYAPKEGLDFLGINIYPGAYDTAYFDLMEAGHRATGLPVVISEWFVQDTDPGDLGYVCGDGATIAEQAVFGADLAQRSAGCAGYIWQTYRPGSGSLLTDHAGTLRPFFLHLALLGKAQARADLAWALDGFGYRSTNVEVRPTTGEANRAPGITYKQPVECPFTAPCKLTPTSPGVLMRSGRLESGALVAGGEGQISPEAELLALVELPAGQRYRLVATASCSGSSDGTIEAFATGAPCGSQRLAQGEKEYTFDLTAPTGPCYVGFRMKAGSSPVGEARLTGISIEAAGEASQPALLPMQRIQHDFDSLPVVFEEDFSTLDPARWKRWQGTAAGAKWSLTPEGWLEIEGEPDSRAGLAMAEAIQADVAVIEVRGRCLSGNLIVNLLLEEAFPREPVWDWLLVPGALKHYVSPSGFQGESRLEFGWAQGGVWEWRISNGVGQSGPWAPLEADGSDLVYRIEKVGCEYTLVANGERKWSVREPALSGAFRVMLYGYGDSRTQWDYVRIRAK